jgi:imidazolonepropionase-like amidohydrolase
MQAIVRSGPTLHRLKILVNRIDGCGPFANRRCHTPVRAGTHVAVHATAGEATRNTILTGAKSIEHGYDLSDELLHLMKEKRTFLVGTDSPESLLIAMGFNSVKDGRTMAERITDRLRRAHKIGVKMAFGSDVVIDMPGKNRGQMAMDYLDVWLAAGIPSAGILMCLTTNGAELLEIQHRRGNIKPGLAADIIATHGNPLQDIHSLRSAMFVMKEGTVVKGGK